MRQHGGQHSHVIQRVRDALALYTPIGLQDLGGAQLMDRTDTKFVMEAERAPQMLKDLLPFFKVLTIDEEVLFSYSSTYFDAHDFLLYRKHHVNRPQRYKVRTRDYLDTGTSFLELKTKKNESQTRKTRIQVPFHAAHTSGTKSDKLSIHGLQHLLQHDLDFPQAPALESTLRIFYQRITLVSTERNERLTIDLGLHFQALRTLGPQSSVALQPLMLLELKQPRLNRQSAVWQYLHQASAHRMGFSKYCMGIAMLSDGVTGPRYNNFKPALRQLARRFSLSL